MYSGPMPRQTSPSRSQAPVYYFSLVYHRNKKQQTQTQRHRDTHTSLVNNKREEKNTKQFPAVEEIPFLATLNFKGNKVVSTQPTLHPHHLHFTLLDSPSFVSPLVPPHQHFFFFFFHQRGVQCCYSFYVYNMCATGYVFFISFSTPRD
jgi:hypothetical protein